MKTLIGSTSHCEVDVEVLNRRSVAFSDNEFIIVCYPTDASVVKKLSHFLAYYLGGSEESQVTGYDEIGVDDVSKLARKKTENRG